MPDLVSLHKHYQLLADKQQARRVSGWQREVVPKDGGGVLYAPNHPNKYFINYCHEWLIKPTVQGARILLVLEQFMLEGSTSKQHSRDVTLRS